MRKTLSIALLASRRRLRSQAGRQVPSALVHPEMAEARLHAECKMLPLLGLANMIVHVFARSQWRTCASNLPNGGDLDCLFLHKDGLRNALS